MNRPPVALLLALGSLACGGSSGARAIFDQRHAICDGLVVNGRTVTEAASALGTFPATLDCKDPGPGQFAPIDPNRGPDSCDYTQPVCETAFEWIAGDNDLCSSFGCAYFCATRSPATPPADPTSGLSDAVVCAAHWESGQSP